MSVSTTVNFEDGLYVPFRGVDREAGFVGTFEINGADIGDGSGGTVTVSFASKRLEFGFHPIFVPTRIMTFDDQAAPTTVRVGIVETGNERLSDPFSEAKLSIGVPDTSNFANFTDLAIPIEVQIETNTDVVQAFWPTNTNAKVYAARLFCVVYDAEAIARGKVQGKSLDTLLGGVR